MSPTSDADGERERDVPADGPHTDIGDDQRSSHTEDRARTRRRTLLGIGLGLGLLTGTGRAGARPKGRPWQRDVDANGNALRNLGGLHMAGMADEARIADFAGPNLEIDDASLRVSDRLDLETITLERVTATERLRASTVDADDVTATSSVHTAELAGGVTGGKRLESLVGQNLSITDNRLDADTHWRSEDALLAPGDDGVEGIAVESVESPASSDLTVDADGGLVLSISGGDGAVRIETDGGHAIVLDDEAESISVEDSTGNRFEMDATTGEVGISATEKITLDAPTIDISADVNLNVESEGAVNVEADGNANLLSAGVMDIEGATISLNGPGNPAARAGDAIDDGTDIIERGSTTVTIG